jgi:hypothetical protein
VSERILAETPQPQLGAMLAGRPASIYAGGHTHLQLLRRLGETLYLNPGSVGLPCPPATPPCPIRASPTTPSSKSKKAPQASSCAASKSTPRALERAATESGMPYPRDWAALLAGRIARRNTESIQALN